MSIEAKLSGITADRNAIRAKLVELGLATNTDKLHALAEAVAGLVNQGAVSVEIVEGSTYTIPAGIHNGSGVVRAVSDTAGDAEAYKTQAKTATPTKKQQSVTPDAGYYALESVTINPIPDAYQDVTPVTAGASDVLVGKIIVDKDGNVIAGTMSNNGALNLSIDGLTTTSVAIPAGYTSGGTVSLTGDIESALAAI